MRPSQRKEMAIHAVQQKDVSVAFACRTFMVSESCYRYKRKLSDENETIGDWLVRLTTAHRTWGFCGLWPMFSVSSQCEGICVEPQTSKTHLL